MKAFQHDKTIGHDEWLTPPEIIQKLSPFDLDPCSPINRPWDTANNYYTIEDNGLEQPWFGFVWCNPPYGKETKKWLQKMEQHNRGIALVFARTDTIAWHNYIFKTATAICFIQGRLTFYTVEGIKGKDTAGAPSALIGYGEEAYNRLIISNLGKTIRVN